MNNVNKSKFYNSLHQNYDNKKFNYSNQHYKPDNNMNNHNQSNHLPENTNQGPYSGQNNDLSNKKTFNNKN